MLSRKLSSQPLLNKTSNSARIPITLKFLRSYTILHTTNEKTNITTVKISITHFNATARQTNQIDFGRVILLT